VTHQGSTEAVAANLAENGATEEEIGFLLKSRVELNALPSDQLVAFIEHKLDEVGIKKVVPDRPVLAEACRRAQTLAILESNIHNQLEAAKAEAEGMAIPDDIDEQVRAMLAKDPKLPWDHALVRVVSSGDKQPR
jgi:hypothetical protein